RRAYNPMTPDELEAMCPGIDWPALAAGAQVPVGATVVAQQPSYLAALAAVVHWERLSTWQLYLKARRLDDAAAVLPLAFRRARFEFRGQVLQGLKTPTPRWQSAMQRLDATLGEAVGELYVAQYF